MWRFASKTVVGLLLVTVLMSAGASAATDVPPRGAGGQTLVVPPEQLDLGEVYHVTPGMGTQFVWHSEAPLMRIMAVCNRVVGYVVTPFDIEEGQNPLLAGAWRIPVASLSTGSERYDAEFHGPQALNRAEYPEITFAITGVRDAKLTADEPDRQRYTLTVAGELTVKDHTVPVEIPVRLTLVPFTMQSYQLGMGDALIMRGEFDVPVADLGLEQTNPRSRDYAAQTAHFDFFLLCNTMSPERNLDPDTPHEQARKQMQFLTRLRDFNEPQQAYEFGRAFMREIWDDGPALNRLAWAALTEEGIQTRDLAFVARAARRANELSDSKDPATLHTLARLYAEKGELDEALKWARLAVEHLEGTPPYVAAQVRATLQRLEARAEKSSGSQKDK